jgi:cell division protein FtsB
VSARGAVRSIGQGRLMIIVCMIAATFVVFFPARQLVAQRTNYEDLQTRLAQLDMQNKRLSNDIARLQNPDELEVLARERLGLVKPGEHVYLFVSPDATPVPPPVPTLPAHKPVWSRVWSAVAAFFRGKG